MPGINPNRLREMRVVRNMTLEKLADVLGVTKQAVSKYEHGKSIPPSDAVDKMLAVLKMPRKYLLKESVEFNNICSPLFFRASSSTTKGHMEYADVVSRWGYEVVCEIDNHPQNYMDFSVSEKLSIPEKAMELRKQWGIATLPIKNLTDLLEQRGVYIFTIDSAELEIDAYSRIINGVPIIVLNKHKGTSVRWRFNLAHELGHLVMHKDLSDWEFSYRNSEIEQEAHLFAEYFLMPSGSFESSIIAPKLDYFVQLKEEWGVSIGAMIYHCGQIGMIDLRKVKTLQIQMSALGWKKTEPLDDKIEFEMPQKISRLISNQITDEDSFIRFYDRVCLPVDEIERICSLPEGLLTGYDTSAAENQSTTQAIQRDFEQLTLFEFGGDYNA